MSKQVRKANFEVKTVYGSSLRLLLSKLHLVDVESVGSAPFSEVLFVDSAHLHHDISNLEKISFVRKQLKLLLLAQCVYLVEKCQPHHYILRVYFGFGQTLFDSL